MKYTIEIDGKEHEVEVEEQESSFRVIVDGVSHEARIEEKRDTYTSSAPAHAPTHSISPGHRTPSVQSPQSTSPSPSPSPSSALPPGTIPAPMPGTILKITVAPGASVKAGDTLFILEAMKMENEITSPAQGVVKKILVSEGQTVNAGDALIHIA
ncbi:MAG: biotin/lipoyl-binding protein [Theionarchaea archaeon]|nr:biotin/lipoyl-binding protein [Theionarchaea archaeon]